MGNALDAEQLLPTHRTRTAHETQSSCGVL